VPASTFRSMRFVRAAALGSFVAIAAGACSGSTQAAWTFRPEPSPTAAPSAVASASSAPAPSPATSASPAASAPAGGGSAGGTTVAVKAQNIAFDTQDIQAPAGQAFAIAFDNEDAGIPHNIAIQDATGASVFKGEIVTGTTQATYQVPALTAGAYTFICEVHPNMKGTVTVK
jgi:plastocyanin